MFNAKAEGCNGKYACNAYFRHVNHSKLSDQSVSWNKCYGDILSYTLTRVAFVRRSVNLLSLKCPG